MCGIAGFTGIGNKDNLLEMIGTLVHRGPDGEGAFAEGGVYLGHRRLSIIDLSKAGAQPMSNEDGSIWLACNGEIYNFQELRNTLLAQGHRFKSLCDCEVIIHLYEERGADMFEKLNGMFAFALWDRNKQKLYLARDKMGQKPLYYSFIRGAFIFASETQAILRHPVFEKRLNLKSLAKFLLYEHLPTPDCIWDDIAQLPAASYLIFEPGSGQYKINKYWKLNYLPRISLAEDEYLNVLEDKITQSIRRHLVADVPLGVYLSGGMDSSTIAYYGQKILNGRLKTFTVAFKEDTFCEQHKARETAELLKTEHNEIPFDSRDFLKTTFEVIPRLDMPFADSSFIPAYFLNKFSRSRIKVALGGEGGDEIFVGYPIYRAHELSGYLRAVPGFLRKRALIPFINNIPLSYENETWQYRLKKFIEAEKYLDNPYYCQQVWLGAFGPDYLAKLFKDDFKEAIQLENLFENIDLYRLDSQEGESLIDGLMRQTQHKYLMDDGLTKADRASMANGLEMRSPFLDNELVEWVNRVPFNHKYKRGRTKIILKKLMRGKIPEDIIYGRKRGFTPPVAQWLAGDFQDKVKEYIFSDNDLFNVDYIERIWQEHISKKQNHRKLLWTLFVWKLWSGNNL